MPQIRYGIPQMQLQPPPQPPRRRVGAQMGAGVLGAALPSIRYGVGAGVGAERGPALGAMPRERFNVQYGAAAQATPQIQGGAPAPGGPAPAQGGPWPGMYSGYSVSPERKRVGVQYGQPLAGGQPATYGDWRDDAAKWALDHGGNPQDMIRRVIDVYMNPNDPRAADNPHTALSNAKTDDVWAQAFSHAIGRPPNDTEWKEHYYAQNYGSRDPLEGHPEAVQFIQAEAERMHQENVREAQETWRNMQSQIQSGIYE